MLTGVLTDDQARPLAALIAALRPGWDVAGVRQALHQARHRAPAHELAIAAIRCTQGDARTPAVIAMDGPHWHTPGSASDDRYDRCPVPGHTSYAAWNCGACRSEALEAAPTTPTPDPARDAITTRGAQTVRDALERTR